MSKLGDLLIALRPVIERMAGGGHDGEDLFGEVSLAFLEKAEENDAFDPLIRGRIICIAKYRFIARLRQARVRRHASLPSNQSAALAVDDRPIIGDDHESLLAEVTDAIESLSESHRRVIKERVFNKKRFAVIAEEFDVPSSTVRSWYRRALQQLRDVFEDRLDEYLEFLDD